MLEERCRRKCVWRWLWSWPWPRACFHLDRALVLDDKNGFGYDFVLGNDLDLTLSLSWPWFIWSQRHRQTSDRHDMTELFFNRPICSKLRLLLLLLPRLLLLLLLVVVATTPRVMSNLIRVSARTCITVQHMTMTMIKFKHAYVRLLSPDRRVIAVLVAKHRYTKLYYIHVILQHDTLFAKTNQGMSWS